MARRTSQRPRAQFPPGHYTSWSFSLQCEYAAGQRLVQRVVGQVEPRFADYVVADGEFATAPLLHAVGDLGLCAVVHLKDNLPDLLAAA